MKPFKHILYVVEASAAQEAGIARAASLAENNQATLTLIDVVPDDRLAAPRLARAPSPAEFKRGVLSERQAQIEALIAPYRDKIDCHVEVQTGIRFLEVIRAVLRDDHDLVIKTAENPDWCGLLFGSDDMHLLRKCPCPVWLMKPEETADYRCIVAAVDFNLDYPEPDEKALNDHIMDLAGALALSDFSDLHFVHVWDAPDAGFFSMWTHQPDMTEKNFVEAEYSRQKVGMDQLTHQFRERIGSETYDYLAPRVHLPRGMARKKIPELVKQLGADLVVMGTVARSGIPGFIIGNTAEAVLYQLQCSVLALKPPGFVSPVILE